MYNFINKWVFLKVLYILPGCTTLSTNGCFSRYLATAKPFFMCSFILKCKVFNPLLTR